LLEANPKPLLQAFYIYSGKKPGLGVGVTPAATPGPSKEWLLQKGLNEEVYGRCHTAPGTSDRPYTGKNMPSLHYVCAMNE